MLVIEMKKVVPWAAMTNKWTKPEYSVLANYIDDIELLSVRNSLRRRHWSILVVLLGGFLSGSLTPFASGLFYVDPIHESTSNATLVRTSRLKFNNSIMAFDPLTRYVQQPIAALVGKSRYDSLLPPWTSNEYAFESFNLSDRIQDVTLTTESVAFAGSLDCGVLKYDSKVTRDWYTENYAYGDPTLTTPGNMTDVELIPNEEDMVRNNCQIPPAMYPKVIFSRPRNGSVEVLPAATLNVTQCSGTGDMPLTMTIMTLLSEKGDDISISFNTTGVLCRPRFNTRTVELSVNATTAEIVKIRNVSNTSVPVDIGINSTRLSGAINRGGSTWMFSRGSFDYMEYESLVGFQDNYWAALLHSETGYAPYTPAGFVGRDPWFSMLSSGDVSKVRYYAANLTALSLDSSQLFQRTMAQIANFGFKSNDSSPVSGFVKVRKPRMTIQRSSLLFLQFTLGFLGIVAACCATILRPKTCLNEDPATLTGLSIITASSEEFQGQIMRKGHFDDICFREELDGLEFRLSNDGCSKPSIEIQVCTVSLLAKLTRMGISALKPE